MIHEVKIRNFQSLRGMDVKLGKFTVITGPNGTGKSAFIRAVRLLAFNARGTSYVTRGAKTAEVTMSGYEDADTAWVVSAQRGGENSYHVIDGGLLKDGQTFTKLAGKVPEEASRVLRISDLNFADQFGMPFLLDSTGSEVARVLGKLTNVTLLYRAAQEANRRRLASAAMLKSRQADLDALNAQKARYATLPAEREAVEEAEAALARVQQLQATRDRLWALTSAVAQRQAWLDMAREMPEPPSTEKLDGLLASRSRLAQMAEAVRAGIVQDNRAQHALVSADEANRVADAELRAYLDKWGVCPACGQPVPKDHAHKEQT